MGGGTGTSASPLVAQAAREQGAVTIVLVTTPFGFERRRKAIADDGVSALRETVDALIVVSNERLMQLAGKDTGAFEAYRQADDVLRLGIQGISDLITIPGLINLDFADIHSIIANAGTAYRSIGEASGENRAETVAWGALSNPLLELDIKGARGLIFNITGGDDLALREVGQIADILSGAAHPGPISSSAQSTIWRAKASSSSLSSPLDSSRRPPRRRHSMRESHRAPVCHANQQSRHHIRSIPARPQGCPTLPGAILRANIRRAPTGQRG